MLGWIKGAFCVFIVVNWNVWIFRLLFILIFIFNNSDLLSALNPGEPTTKLVFSFLLLEFVVVVVVGLDVA